MDDGQAPIESLEELAAYFDSGCKPEADWRIGTEHEKFLFERATLRPMDYRQGVGPWLEGMRRFGWQPILEDGRIIALKRGQASITLEPGGQVELSGAPLRTLHETCAEVRGHLREGLEVAREIGAGLLGIGFLPQWRRQDMPWMPKARYAIMRRYMPKKGRLGLDMMQRCCTIQGNFDYDSESSMRRCFRVALALQPVAVALFAQSPLREGKESGYLSYRSHVWNDTDPDRCGVPACVFEPGFGFERYRDYLLDVPMYFIRRQGRYIDAAGQSFRDFLDGRLPACPGQKPRWDDWTDHVSTVFTEARLKTFLEVRGADSGGIECLCALSAFWCGLFYDASTRDEAWRMVRRWPMERHKELRLRTPKEGLAVRVGRESMADFAGRVVALAAQGLKRRARRDSSGRDESLYLAPLQDILRRRRTIAEDLLDRWRGEWQGKIEPLYAACTY